MQSGPPVPAYVIVGAGSTRAWLRIGCPHDDSAARPIAWQREPLP